MLHGPEWWDNFFLGLAKYAATASKDPSTQTGAVIVDPETKAIVSIGFNGFPRGIADDDRLNDRAIKYEIVVHCEINALVFARRSLEHCTLYTYPFMSCSRCAAIMIQAGITRCVAPIATSEQNERWGENFKLTRQLFVEAGVELLEVPRG